MKNIQITSKKFSYSKKEFRLYLQNDILSLFFNSQKALLKLKNGESKKFIAVGSRNNDCTIDVKAPDTKTKKELQAIMPDKIGNLIAIIIHQDIFQSKNGELYVNLDNNGFAKDVLLKDVIMFGDIRGKRTKQYEILSEDSDKICL